MINNRRINDEQQKGLKSQLTETSRMMTFGFVRVLFYRFLLFISKLLFVKDL